MNLPAWIRAKLHSPHAGERRSAKYYARRRLATPLWADRARIAEIYREARRRSTPARRFVVDHIVPLSHPRVCGLHWHANLEVVEEQINATKCNHWWPDMPEYQSALSLECCCIYQMELPL